MKYCVFSAPDKNMSRLFKLNDDGSISDLVGSGHDNERFWAESEQEFILFSKNKEATCRLVKKTVDGSFTCFEGRNKYGVRLTIKTTKIRSDLLESKTKFLHKEDVAKGIMKVGDHTYGAIGLIDKRYGKIIIGDYCSIAAGVTAIMGNHRLDMVSTYPFHTVSPYFCDTVPAEADHYSNGTTVIGNDVWIGRNAILMSGVQVGDGAVIAAHAVVTKDVEPYSVVGGNPAKHLKYRIIEEVKRRKLQEIAWWHWEESKVVENMNEINSPDIDGFIKKFYVK